MTAQTRAAGFGWLAVAGGAALSGGGGPAVGDFLSGQSVPKDFPARAVLACVVAGFIVLCALAMLWPRTRAWGAAALTAYYGFLVVGILDVGVILRPVGEYVPYSNPAEQLAIAAAGLILFAASARIGAAWAARLARAGQIAFGL